tara:strand:- start:220 stop:369 length:150 start_codon:yes stop_codon:yes gene_type:complete
MEQILNPFEDLNPFDNTIPYEKFKNIILNIKDKKTLLEIGKLLEKILNE